MLQLGHANGASSLTFSSDGRWLVTVGGDVKIWRADTGELLRTFADDRKTVAAALSWGGAIRAASKCGGGTAYGNSLEEGRARRVAMVAL